MGPIPKSVDDAYFSKWFTWTNLFVGKHGGEASLKIHNCMKFTITIKPLANNCKICIDIFVGMPA